METLLNQLQDVLKNIKEAQNVAGRSEKGRFLAIAATDVEKATWALEKAVEIDKGEQYSAEAAIDERKSNPHQD